MVGPDPGTTATTWPATARYQLDPAPGGLGVVQDLLNTISAGVPRQPDLLDDPTSATAWAHDVSARWSAITGRPAPEVALDPAGLRALRRFRDGLREEIGAAADSGRPAPGSADPDPGPLRAAEATLRLDENGVVHLEPTGTGAQALIALVLAALFEAQLTDERRRIKTCGNPRCQVAFYDRSRNNSGVWHSVRVCGRPANLRAHRARRRQLD